MIKIRSIWEAGFPTAELGFTFNATYKSFDLNIFLYSSMGLEKV